MKSILTPGSVAASISMSRKAPKSKDKAVLLVEGSKDSRLYRHFIDRDKCNSFSVSGKSNVLETLQLLRSRGEVGVLALVDADNDHINGTISKDPDVATTDTRDLEGLLLRSPSYAKILNEHQVKLDVNTNERVAAAAVTLGYLRCAAERHNWYIDFKTIPLMNCIDYRQIICNHGAVPKAVLQAPNNKGFGRSEADLAKAIEAERCEIHEPWQVAHGHDMARILAGVLTLYTGRQISAELVESQLRLSYETEEFKKTLLFIMVCEWQKRNDPYIVLKLKCP